MYYVVYSHFEARIIATDMRLQGLAYVSTQVLYFPRAWNSLKFPRKPPVIQVLLNAIRAGIRCKNYISPPKIIL